MLNTYTYVSTMYLPIQGVFETPAQRKKGNIWGFYNAHIEVFKKKWAILLYTYRLTL
jgi:hypothetical protein